MRTDLYGLANWVMKQRAPVFGAMDGDLKLPKEPAGFDDPGVERTYNFLKAHGLKVNEVPQSYLLQRFAVARKEDAIGILDGRNVYLATDYRGRKLPGRIKRAVALHELGHYTKGPSESAAQKEALRLATDVLPDEEARAAMLEFGKAYGWLN
ncbi:MAG: hypothetical protein HY513_00540 [Candidatus Aenigmarchaeota archaeon]|nr:hypothetical protein [Candidatus Aenigmarchaeota archaeon]